MEKIAIFHKIILETLMEYQSQFRQTSQDIQSEIIVDDKAYHYQFLWTGWRGNQHIFSVVFHVDIIKEKIWIQQDNSEVGLANLLVEKGIRKDEIVLGYFPKAHRQYTDFAVA
ncbi:MAG: XisI protein [Bacteroidia bacterium]|nr:XisI protein [Bacteroidia bacterium]